jgi:PKHD-type hydroxylase
MFNISKFSRSLVFPKFGIMDSPFSEEEVDNIRFFEKLMKFEMAHVGSEKNQRVDDNVRKSDISWMPMDQNTEWLWWKIADLCGQANYDLFMYDITTIQSLQYTVYNSNHQHYDWHIDAGESNFTHVRRFSGVLMLSDPDEYEGGHLEIIRGGNLNAIESYKQKKGDLIFFDANMPHRVTPVTDGVRRTLVFWVLGPYC